MVRTDGVSQVTVVTVATCQVNRGDTAASVMNLHPCDDVGLSQACRSLSGHTSSELTVICSAGAQRRGFPAVSTVWNNTPEALVALTSGKNSGQALVRLSPDPYFWSDRAAEVDREAGQAVYRRAL